MMTVELAWGHFQAHELSDPEIGRSESTIENYLTLFQAHIVPRWGVLLSMRLKRSKWKGGLDRWSQCLRRARNQLLRRKNGASSPRPLKRRSKPDVLSFRTRETTQTMRFEPYRHCSAGIETAEETGRADAG